MKSYTIMARMRVDISRTIRAQSLEEAVELAKGLRVTDFVAPAKGADRAFNDYKDLEIYGLVVEGE